MSKPVDELLQHYPALAAMPREALERALAASQIVQMAAGAEVFAEALRCHAFPFVLRGALRVVKRAESGREITLYDLGPGDACAISSACILGNERYGAIGLVQEACELVLMPAAKFRALLEHAAFREAMFDLFARRVLGLMRLVDEVAFQKIDARLARLLVARGPEVRASQQELADELGTVREVVSRVLGGFEARGFVTLGRGRVQVLDAAGLEAHGAL